MNKKNIKKERQKRVKQAVQKEEDRGPNPQKDLYFTQQDWLELIVLQQGKLIKLHTYRQLPQDQPTSVLFMFHGLNSHCNHGGHIAHYFSKKGMIVVGFDYRGFGKSQGISGYLQSFKFHMQDCQKFIQLVQKYLQKYKLQHLPWFITGLSLGGLTAFHLSILLQNKFKGCILMAPALKPVIGGFLMTVGNILGKIMPKTGLGKNQKPVANRNPVVTQYIRADPYAFNDKLPMLTLKTLLNQMDKAGKLFHKMKIPFVVVMGGIDKLVDIQCAQQLIKQSQIQDKQFWYYQDMWHNIWHQPQIDQILEKMDKWIQIRL